MSPSDASPIAPIARALQLSDQGRFAEAVECLARGLEAVGGPDEVQRYATALGELAGASETAGHPEVALRALEIATQVVEWADYWCQLGCLRMQRGRRAEARRAFERALAINPRYRRAAVERALLDAREGRIGEALETLRVLAGEGRVAEPGTFQQGLERLGRADFDDAAPLLHEALDAGDRWLDAQMQRYQELLLLPDPARALEQLRTAALERPNYPDLHLLLGAHELQQGALDDAIESLARALELNPSFHAARIELARALEAVGQTPQALDQIALVLECEPTHSAARQLHDQLTSRRPNARARAESASERS
ncbi:MAG: tetratricopeptide repeat protein [Candidatus Eisenbacteria bacterium]|nr:tetratricopeptide repeat protein [Candidatus Eisenbacteria bacterium]